jgi:hypothetical protein
VCRGRMVSVRPARHNSAFADSHNLQNPRHVVSFNDITAWLWRAMTLVMVFWASAGTYRRTTLSVAQHYYATLHYTARRKYLLSVEGDGFQPISCRTPRSTWDASPAFSHSAAYQLGGKVR